MRTSSYTCRQCLQSIRKRFHVEPLKQAHARQLSSAKKPTKSSFAEKSNPKHRPRPAIALSNRQVPHDVCTRSVSLATAPKHASADEPSVINGAHSQTALASERVLLAPENLFHSFTHSPSPPIRRRAAFMRQHAYCPHPSHQRTRQPTSPDDPESRKLAHDGAQPPAHVNFECPDCGIPVSCSEQHWEDDFESHLEICDTLRQINEDDHDLRSGRFFPEFDYPGPQRAEEFILNMSNWDTFLYTRDFRAIDNSRSMRQVTRLLTYPITIASVLHELSPYSIRKGGRLTNEGLRSFSALRYTLHPPRSGENNTISGLRPRPPPVRLFILGARAESSLPREVWVQLTHCFPRGVFHLIFIGPESMTNRENEFPLPERTAANPFGGIVETRLTTQMKITTYVEYFHTMHATGHFAPYDPYFDVFVLFHPGLGHPASVHEWKDTLPMMLETKCPIICTGYTEWDLERDRRWVTEQVGGEMDVLLEPGENPFRSLRWDLNDLDPTDISCGNWGIWAFRGKRYEATHKDIEA